MMVSEITSDAVTVKMMVPMKLIVNLPAPSGRKSIGTKAKTSTPVDPSTARLISFVPSIAAIVRSLPMRKWRDTFSMTTIESSTSKPSERMNPATTSWLRLKPKA